MFFLSYFRFLMLRIHPFRFVLFAHSTSVYLVPFHILVRPLLSLHFGLFPGFLLSILSRPYWSQSGFFHRHHSTFVLIALCSFSISPPPSLPLSHFLSLSPNFTPICFCVCAFSSPLGKLNTENFPHSSNAHKMLICHMHKPPFLFAYTQKSTQRVFLVFYIPKSNNCPLVFDHFSTLVFSSFTSFVSFNCCAWHFFCIFSILVYLFICLLICWYCLSFHHSSNTPPNILFIIVIRFMWTCSVDLNKHVLSMSSVFVRCVCVCVCMGEYLFIRAQKNHRLISIWIRSVQMFVSGYSKRLFYEIVFHVPYITFIHTKTQVSEWHWDDAETFYAQKSLISMSI